MPPGVWLSAVEPDIDDPMVRGVHVIVDDRRVGYLGWYACDDHPEYDQGTVAYLEVEPGYRRRGLATLLWEHCSKVVEDLHHSPTLTDDAEAWIASLPV